jgi:hypothetical protein
VLLVLLAGLCIASVPLPGGRWGACSSWACAEHRRLRQLALQIAITTLMPAATQRCMTRSPAASAIAGISALISPRTRPCWRTRAGLAGRPHPRARSWPLGHVLSAGDLVLYAGAFVLLHRPAARPPHNSDGDASTVSGLRDA